jgi:arylsulfatase A-like enzyme
MVLDDLELRAVRLLRVSHSNTEHRSARHKWTPLQQLPRHGSLLADKVMLAEGANQHAVGMGVFPDFPISHPGYSGQLPKSAATLPRLLRDNGYCTFAVGKWHLTPRAEASAAGPFDRWPSGVGFERYYGFLGGVTDQWTPDLTMDNAYIEPPASRRTATT